MDRRTRDLLAYLDRVEPRLAKLSHYELLDIPVDADTDAIQKAYHAVAARMHPDHHRARLSPEQYERLNIVYGRIAEAYRCLRNPEEAEEYRRQLAGTVARDDSPVVDSEAAAVDLLSPKAQRLYRRAQAALRTGDQASALLNLKMALRSAPNSALLKAALADLRAKPGR